MVFKKASLEDKGIYSGGDSTAWPGTTAVACSWCPAGADLVQGLPSSAVEGKPPEAIETFIMQLEVDTVCEACLSASLHPAQQPVRKVPVPADLQGAQPSKYEVGSVASWI